MAHRLEEEYRTILSVKSIKDLMNPMVYSNWIRDSSLRAEFATCFNQLYQGMHENNRVVLAQAIEAIILAYKSLFGIPNATYSYQAVYEHVNEIKHYLKIQTQHKETPIVQACQATLHGFSTLVYYLKQLNDPDGWNPVHGLLLLSTALLQLYNVPIVYDALHPLSSFSTPTTSMQFHLTESSPPFSLSGFGSFEEPTIAPPSSLPVAPPGFHQEHMPIPPSFDYSSNLTSGFSSLGLTPAPSDGMRIAISPPKPAFERRVSGSSPHQSSSGLGLFRASSPQNAPDSSSFQMNLESTAFSGFSMMSSPTLSSYTSPGTSQSSFSPAPLAQPTFQRALSAPITSSTSPPTSQSSSSYASIISKQPPRPPPVALPKCRKFSRAKQEAFKQALNTETGVPGVYLSYFRRYCDDQLRLVPRAQLCLNKCISGCNKSHTVLDVMRYNPLYKLFVCCDESHYDGKERANCAGVHFDFDELKWDLNRLKELIREKSNLCNRKLTCTDDNCIKSHSVEEICWYRPNFRTEQCNTPKAHNTAICWYYHTESDKRYLGDMVGRAIEVPFITRSAHRKMAYELEKLAKMNCLCTE